MCPQKMLARILLFSGMEAAQLFLPGIAIVISVIALYFSRKSWMDSNRPIIILRISGQGMGGDLLTPLSLVVENTGNRPAIDIVIKWSGNDYLEAFNVPPGDQRRAQFEKRYSDGVPIPVLANGRSLTTSFGFVAPDKNIPLIGEPPTWRADYRFPMAVKYRDLDGRSYSETNPLIMADDEGFGGGIWKTKS